MAGELSPALQLAVHLIAQGEAICAYLCDHVPLTVEDMKEHALGVGWVDVNGGEIKLHRKGWIECVGYDVGGSLVVTKPNYCPQFGRAGQRARVGTLTMDAGVERQ